MKWRYGAALLCAVLLLGSSLAATYVFEHSVVTGIGFRSHEIIGQTARDYAGQKFLERITGTGSFDDDTRFEIDAVRNSINFTQDATFEYFPVSYQTGDYDHKWIDRICVMNYDSGAVLTESYDHVESLSKSTEIKTIGNRSAQSLQAHLSANVIGVAHIGWLSRSPEPLGKGRYVETGRTVEDLTGVFSIEKTIQLSNVSGNASLIDWLPCM